MTHMSKQAVHKQQIKKKKLVSDFVYVYKKRANIKKMEQFEEKNR